MSSTVGSITGYKRYYRCQLTLRKDLYWATSGYLSCIGTDPCITIIIRRFSSATIRTTPKIFSTREDLSIATKFNQEEGTILHRFGEEPSANSGKTWIGLLRTQNYMVLGLRSTITSIGAGGGTLHRFDLHYLLSSVQNYSIKATPHLRCSYSPIALVGHKITNFFQPIIPGWCPRKRWGRFPGLDMLFIQYTDADILYCSSLLLVYLSNHLQSNYKNACFRIKYIQCNY